MKTLFNALLFFGMITFAQPTNCQYDFEENTDQINIKSMPEVLMHERIFGSTYSYLFFTLQNNNGVPLLKVNFLDKSKDFLPSLSLLKNSRISIQLLNGKIVTLINALEEESYSKLIYDTNENTNIRILEGNFLFTKSNFQELQLSPISLIRIQFLAENKDYVLQKELQSETLKTTYKPESYFIEQLKCVL